MRDTQTNLTSVEKQLLQARLTPEAYLRIKVEAAKTSVAAGDVISSLAERYLPPVTPTGPLTEG